MEDGVVSRAESRTLPAAGEKPSYLRSGSPLLRCHFSYGKRLA